VFPVRYELSLYMPFRRNLDLLYIGQTRDGCGSRPYGQRILFPGTVSTVSCAVHVTTPATAGRASVVCLRTSCLAYPQGKLEFPPQITLDRRSVGHFVQR
jgi:hypothetical protein